MERDVCMNWEKLQSEVRCAMRGAFLHWVSVGVEQYGVYDVM